MYEFGLWKEGEECIGERILETIQPPLKILLNKIKEFCSKQDYLHYIRADSLHANIKVAKTMSFNVQSQSNCSIATDGAYLYVIKYIYIYIYRYS